MPTDTSTLYPVRHFECGETAFYLDRKPTGADIYQKFGIVALDGTPMRLNTVCCPHCGATLQLAYWRDGETRAITVAKN